MEQQKEFFPPATRHSVYNTQVRQSDSFVRNNCENIQINIQLTHSAEFQARSSFTVKPNKSFSPIGKQYGQPLKQIPLNNQTSQTPVFSQLNETSFNSAASKSTVSQQNVSMWPNKFAMKKSFESVRDSKVDDSFNTSRMKNQKQSKATATTQKVILLGDATVGKTSIFTRLTQNVFNPKRDHCTAQMDIGRKVFYISTTESQKNDYSYESNQNNTTQSTAITQHQSSTVQEVNMQLWDTPGQEVYRSLVSCYYRNIHGVVLVVSLEDSPSTQRVKEYLKGLDYWMDELNNSSEISEKLSFIILGNKADLDSSNYSPCDELIKSWCQQKLLEYDVKVDYFKTSAKTGNGIEKAFTHLSKTILEKPAKGQTDCGMKLGIQRLSGIPESELMSPKYSGRDSMDSVLQSPKPRQHHKKKCTC